MRPAIRLHTGFDTLLKPAIPPFTSVPRNLLHAMQVVAAAITALSFLLTPAIEAADAPARKAVLARDVVYVSTPQAVVDKMLEMAAIKPGDIVYDLGCGDGRAVVTAAKRYGVKAVGVDIDPARVKESIENVRANKLEHLVSIQQKDIFTMDFQEATVVFLYLLPALNTRLMPQLAKLKPGSRIVSHDFDMGDAKPSQIIILTTDNEPGVRRDWGKNEHILYKWIVPWATEPLTSSGRSKTGSGK